MRRALVLPLLLAATAPRAEETTPASAAPPSEAPVAQSAPPAAPEPAPAAKPAASPNKPGQQLIFGGNHQGVDFQQ